MDEHRALAEYLTKENGSRANAVVLNMTTILASWHRDEFAAFMVNVAQHLPPEPGAERTTVIPFPDKCGGS